MNPSKYMNLEMCCKATKTVHHQLQSAQTRSAWKNANPHSLKEA